MVKAAKGKALGQSAVGLGLTIALAWTFTLRCLKVVSDATERGAYDRSKKEDVLKVREGAGCR